jgi:hypothetical protein
MTIVPLARMNGDRRWRSRRESQTEPILSTQHVFEQWERLVLKAMERRREMRRERDIKARLARLA